MEELRKESMPVGVHDEESRTLTSLGLVQEPQLGRANAQAGGRQPDVG